MWDEKFIKEVFFSFTDVFKFSSLSLITQVIIDIYSGFFKYLTGYILRYL